MLCWMMGCGAILLLAVESIQAAPAETYSAASLVSELHRLQGELHDGLRDKRAPALPSAWEVETPDGQYSISTEPLSTLLANGDQARQASAIAWLDQLAEHLSGFSEAASSASGSASGARTKLDQILTRGEFGGVGPPSYLELLRRRIAEWIQGWLSRLFAFVNQHPATSRVFFWVLVSGAAGLLILWLVRLGRGDRTVLTLQGPDQALRARAWAEWVAAARQAADHGDLRQAIHCAYWAGVARLQETGVLSGDRTRTPREYLRLVSGPETPHLGALTSGLERYWYAGRAAAVDDFSESLRHLEALGCTVGGGAE
jgi:hypothetical protein